MRMVLLVAVLAVIVGGQACQLEAQTMPAAVQQLSGPSGINTTLRPPAPEGIDSLHPRNFVTVDEVSRRGKIRSLYSRGGEKVNIEIDRSSKLLIHIDQAFLGAAGFEGYFGITGAIYPSSGDPRPIEIPGYSVIGKAAETVPVSVGAVSSMNAIMAELYHEWIELDRNISAARKAADQKGDQQQKVVAGLPAKQNGIVQAQANFEARQKEVESANTRHMMAEARLDTTRSLRADSAVDKTNRDAAALELQQAQSRLESTQALLQELRSSLLADSLVLQRETNREFLVKAQDALNAGSHTRIALKALYSPQNAALVRLFARSVNRMPEVVINLAETSDSLWGKIGGADFTMVIGDVALARWVSSVGNFRSAFEDLSLLGRTVDTSSSLSKRELTPFARLAVGAIKDAEILIRQTGAHPGDRIALTFTDSLVGQAASTRSMTVQVVVRDFGFVQKVSDAVLLMKLAGFPEKGASEAAQARANLTGEANSLTFPLRTRGNPAAGVTLAWTYFPRVEDDDAKLPRALRVAAAWLRPGFGLNASVPSVPQKAVTFTPNKTASEEAKDPEVAYTAGVIITAFDNLVSFSKGRTLTGPKGRTYTAWGISFLSATEKARELFKSLDR